MDRQIFLDDIDDPVGGQALRRALEVFQGQLPHGNRMCGCVHRLGGMVWARVQVFVDGQSYEMEWGGRRLLEFAQFIEDQLLPILRTWKRSLPEFFQSLRLRCGAQNFPCRRSNCVVYEAMKKKSTLRGACSS